MTDTEKAYQELDKCLQCSNIDALLKLQAENAKLRDENLEVRRRLGDSIDSRNFAERRLGNLVEVVKDLYVEMITYSRAPNYNRSVWKPTLEAMGIEVPE